MNYLNTITVDTLNWNNRTNSNPIRDIKNVVDTIVLLGKKPKVLFLTPDELFWLKSEYPRERTIAYIIEDLKNYFGFEYVASGDKAMIGWDMLSEQYEWKDVSYYE
jgi:hypothetical protein